MKVKQIEENTTYYRDIGKFPSLDEITFMEILGQEILIDNSIKTIDDSNFEDDDAGIHNCVLIIDFDDGTQIEVTNAEFMQLVRVNKIF